MQIPHPYKVYDVRRELEDVVTLHLQPEQSDKTAFHPGQFSMLYMFGHGEIPISISGNPTKDDSLLYTVRGIGSISKALIDAKTGTTIGVRGPFGCGWPLEEGDGKHVLIIAGGLGIAPLRPLLHALFARQKHTSLSLLYGCRTPNHSLYERQLRTWEEERLMNFEMTVDYPSPSYQGNVGVVTKLISRFLIRREPTLVCLCGPEVMMRFAINELIRCGINEEHIYLSMERNMKCATAWCGRCQFGSSFVCKDGPVFQYSKIQEQLRIREL